MSEVIEGLYKGFDSLIGTYSDHQKLHEEFSLILSSFRTSQTYANQESHETRIIIFQNELSLAYLKDYFDKHSLFEESRAKADKIYKESLTNYRLKLESANQELVKEISKNSMLQQQVDTLSHQIKELKKKTIKKSNQHDMNEDLICMKCKKIYKEVENFNWSCRTHLNEYNGKEFWCCGSKNKESLGCVIRKHVSFETQNDPDFNSSHFPKFCAVRIKKSCKTVGHSIKSCPKDPNIKSIPKSENFPTFYPTSDPILSQDFKSEMARVDHQRKSKIKSIRISELSLPESFIQKFDPVENDSEGLSRNSEGFYSEFSDLDLIKKLLD